MEGTAARHDSRRVDYDFERQVEFVYEGKEEFDLLWLGQVGTDGETVYAEGADLFDGLFGFVRRSAVMQCDGIAHTGKGKGEGFAEPMGGTGYEGEGGCHCVLGGAYNHQRGF